jgi:hypothetical protein
MHVIQNIFGAIYFFWNALKVPPSDFIQKMWNSRQKWINWIFSKMRHSIWKSLFDLGDYEYLERQEGKIRKILFFYVKIF